MTARIILKRHIGMPPFSSHIFRIRVEVECLDFFLGGVGEAERVDVEGPEFAAEGFLLVFGYVLFA